MRRCLALGPGQGIVAGEARVPEVALSQCNKFCGSTYAMGLGRVKTLCGKRRWRGSIGISGSDYALIAAMSGWIPMMFITRVRL
jgi:hypothetical protein